MKRAKSLAVMAVFGIGLSGTVMVIAGSNKINDQADITISNAMSEIESIMSTDERKLFYESSLSGNGEEVYTNREGDYYYFEESGEMIGYNCNEEAFGKNGAKASEEDVKKAAEAYLTNAVEDPSYYQLSSMDYDEYVYVHKLYYTHQIDGIETSDTVILGIDNELNLVTLFLPRPNAFQDLDNMQINKDEISQTALEMLSEKYEGSMDGATITGLSLVEKDEKICYLVYVTSYNTVGEEKIETLDTVYIPI